MSKSVEYALSVCTPNPTSVTLTADELFVLIRDAHRARIQQERSEWETIRESARKLVKNLEKEGWV